ncbi:uncharacterized protein N7500_000294 [Penicillium coprophilum]|uniref:uncharacterized protein n=1 Tax=Penicillium coprophilum TaxID=36646 RepID=UPI00238C250E|nr:uncharacterized protein N7500_000294 [Penicillium coprophilum]KAJ5177595.1 hypothetical protein N7500_000294 [Penicillium coprophilum]
MSLQAVAGYRPCHQATAVRLLADSLYESTRGSTALTNQAQNELGLLLGMLSATEVYASSLGAGCVHFTVLKKRLETCDVILRELQKLVLHPDTFGAQSLISDIRARLSSVIFGISEMNLNMMTSSQKIIESAMRCFLDDIRAGKRDALIASDVLKDSSKLEKNEAWTRLQGELVATGIAPDLVALNRDFAISTLQKIVETESPLPFKGDTAPVEEVHEYTAPAPNLELERQRSLDDNDYLSDEPGGLPFLPLPPKGLSFSDKHSSNSSQVQPYPRKEAIREDFPIPVRLDMQDCTDTQKQVLPANNFPIPAKLDMQDCTDTQKQALPSNDFPIPVRLDIHDSTDTQKEALPIEDFPIPASTESTLPYIDMDLPETVKAPIERRPSAPIQRRPFNPSLDIYPFRVTKNLERPHRMSRMLWDMTKSKKGFMSAIASNQYVVVQTFLSKGADVNAQTLQGLTALMYAVSLNHEGIVRLLIEYGAEINERTLKGESALSIAAGRGYDRLVRTLIASGANINAGTGNGRTALSQAATYGQDRIVELLLECGANINAVNITGETALAMAALNGNMRVAKLLLGRGAAVDHMRYPWHTPLYKAVQSDEVEMARLLVQYGANPFVKGGTGRKEMVFDIARNMQRRQILEIFEQHGYRLGGPVRYQYF